MALSKAPSSRAREIAGLAVALACGLAIASTGLFLLVMPFIRALYGSRDFVVYWATGQQLVHHGDPYNPRIMGAIEHAAGYTGTGSYYMRNPPWGVWLTWPLGFVDAHIAALPWSLFVLSLLILCVRILWQIFDRPASQFLWMACCFPPAMECVIMGQTSLFLLLGLVLFLRYHRTRPFWAGAALWFCTLKPHVFVPFGLALILWIVLTRAWRIFAGSLAALLVSSLITEAIAPHAWSEYLYWAHHSGISHEYMPCLAITLRNLIAPSAEWIAFLPCILAGIWALFYFWRRRHSWDWIEHGNVLMLVSVLVAPYLWLYDQVLVLPAILWALCRTRSQAAITALAAIYIVIVVQPYIAGVSLRSPIYLWPAPAWLVWYWFARRSRPEPESPAPVAALQASA